MTLLQKAKQYKPLNLHRFSCVVKLHDGAKTTLHVVRYNRSEFRPRIIAFQKPTYLAKWCKLSKVDEALVGGFYIRSSNQLLGECWINGVEQETAPFTSPWNKNRGSIHINNVNGLSLGARNEYPIKLDGDLLQAGPLLIRKGNNLIANGSDDEGFSQASDQFDSDITIGRYPRAAIGTDSKYIWSVVCDGRSSNDSGLTLNELAKVMISLGAQDALNLDGGGSSTQISAGRLRNHPRGDNQEYQYGRSIFSAILFESS